MPRAIVELSHAMPDTTLIPFAVVGDKWRDEPWWTSGATLRLLLSEYAKYVAAELRVRLADIGIDLTPESTEPPAARAAPAGNGAGQLASNPYTVEYLQLLPLCHGFRRCLCPSIGSSS